MNLENTFVEGDKKLLPFIIYLVFAFLHYVQQK